MNTDLSSELIFSIEIDQLMSEHGLTLMEAAIHWSENRGLEIEYAAGLIKKNRDMKRKLRQEAETLRMVKTAD